MTLGSLPRKCFDREWSDCLQDTQHVFFFFKPHILFSPRVEVRDPPEGDRQGRTPVHSCLYSGFLGSPPGKVRRGRGIVSSLGGASPSSQRKRKTGLEGLAQCPPTVSDARCLPDERGRSLDEALLQSGFHPRPLLQESRLLVAFLFLLSAWPGLGRVVGSGGASCPVELPWAKGREGVDVALDTPLASICSLPNPVLGGILGGNIWWMKRCSLEWRNELSGSGSKPCTEWEELPCSGAV